MCLFYLLHQRKERNICTHIFVGHQYGCIFGALKIVRHFNLLLLSRVVKLAATFLWRRFEHNALITHLLPYIFYAICIVDILKYFFCSSNKF